MNYEIEQGVLMCRSWYRFDFFILLIYIKQKIEWPEDTILPRISITRGPKEKTEKTDFETETIFETAVNDIGQEPN